MTKKDFFNGVSGKGKKKGSGGCPFCVYSIPISQWLGTAYLAAETLSKLPSVILTELIKWLLTQSILSLWYTSSKSYILEIAALPSAFATSARWFLVFLAIYSISTSHQCNDSSCFSAVYLVFGATYAYYFGMSCNHDDLPDCLNDYDF